MQSELGLGLLATLSLMSGQELLKSEMFLRGIKETPQSPDEVIKEIFDDIANMSSDDKKAILL